MNAGFEETGGKAGLARKLMRDRAALGHEQGVVAGGAGQVVVPLQGGEMAGGALAVRGVKEDALVAGGGRRPGLGGKTCREEK